MDDELLPQGKEKTNMNITKTLWGINNCRGYTNLSFVIWK